MISYRIVGLLFLARLTASEPPAQPYDVIVVGLGASGVGALSRLAERGRRVLGLESKGRLGGRVNTQEFGGGLVEFGAEWIHGECEGYQLARQNNVSIIDTDWTPNFGSEGTPNFGSRSVINESTVAEIFTHFMDLYYVGGDLENITVGQFLTEKFYEHVADKPEIVADKEFCENFLKMFELVLASLDATDSWHDISIKGDGYYKQCPGSQGWSWNILGYRTLFDILLHKYNNGSGLPVDIHLNSKVSKIDWSENDTVAVTAGSNTYYAKSVIVTVSLGVLKHSHAKLFEPSLPYLKAQAIASLSIGVVNKICLYYEHIWWGQQKSMLFLWNNEDRKTVAPEDWWIMDVNSFSVPMSNEKVLTLWITGQAARYMESLDIGVVKEKSKLLLEIFFKKSNRTVADAKDIRRSQWYSDPDVLGSYSYRGLASDAVPAAVTQLAAPLPASNPRLQFAGEATSTDHFSTVHGALETGWREADRYLESNPIA